MMMHDEIDEIDEMKSMVVGMLEKEWFTWQGTTQTDGRPQYMRNV